MGLGKFKVSDDFLKWVIPNLPEGMKLIEVQTVRPKYIQRALEDDENWRLLPGTMRILATDLPDTYELMVEHTDIPNGAVRDLSFAHSPREGFVWEILTEEN